MPKRATLEEDGKDTILKDLPPTEPASNGSFDHTQLRGFVAEYENEGEKIRAILEKARTECQPHIDQQKAIAKEAAEAGVDKKVFKAKMSERRFLRRADHVRATLSERGQDLFDEVSLALGKLANEVASMDPEARAAHLAALAEEPDHV